MHVHIPEAQPQLRLVLREKEQTHYNSKQAIAGEESIIFVIFTKHNKVIRKYRMDSNPFLLDPKVLLMSTYKRCMVSGFQHNNVPTDSISGFCFGANSITRWIKKKSSLFSQGHLVQCEPRKQSNGNEKLLFESHPFGYTEPVQPANGTNPTLATTHNLHPMRPTPSPTTPQTEKGKRTTPSIVATTNSTP